MEEIKKCIAWAAQNGYYKAEDAAKEVTKITGEEMYEDQPYYSAYAWRKVETK